MFSARRVFACLLLIVCYYVYAQDVFFSTGLEPDDGTYEQLERKNDLLTRDYGGLPSSYSLQKYCPYPKSQENYGTCTGWATAYACRTIAEAIKYGWTDKSKITSEAFSPIFVYALIKEQSTDNNCQRGSQIYKALQVMKEKGVSKYASFSVLCAGSVNETLLQQAKSYRIDDFFTLFSYYETDASRKIYKVKKALSEDCPVVIAMHIPKSFFMARQVWSVSSVDPSNHGYHAMCVVGFNDNMQGGAFLIMNSWGTGWGDNGFIWVKYSDFAQFVDQAYEIYVRKEVRPSPTPDIIIDPTKPNSLSGQVRMQLSTGEQMVATLDKTAGLTRYRLTQSLISGTRYRLYISNNEPAYVYVIGSDLTNSISKVFPPADNISAALTYKSNNIAIPDERYFIEMDNTKGTDYMCVLYSKDALNINTVISKMRSVNGSFYDKLKTALSGKIVPLQDIVSQNSTISFRAQTQYTVVPIIVEITHR